ncbi:hypothetical protein HGRIS_009061 [Hohenbuehelia grisea]
MVDRTVAHSNTFDNSPLSNSEKTSRPSSTSDFNTVVSASTSKRSSLSDLEKGRPSSSSDSAPSSRQFASTSTLQGSADAQPSSNDNIVTWDGPDDTANPRNWSRKRKWTVTLVVSFFTFMSPVGSSISSPTLPAISEALGITPGSILENMTLSIFVLAYALGPLFWGPLSELIGRLPVILSSNLWFLIFNTACSFSKTPTQMLVFRFLAGFGGAAPQSIGGGIVGDLWSPAERAMAMSIYSIAPLVGPSTGPFVGGWIAQKADWHWVFWSVSIADAILQIAGFILLRETYAPELLKRKARTLRKATGNDKLRSPYELPDRRWTSVMGRGMIKPLQFLCVEPIVQVFALYMAVLYGVLYLSLTTFVKVFTSQYHEVPGIAGLHYLAIALGSTVGGQIGARALNAIYRRLQEKNGGIGTPEMRLPFLMISATTLPIGLLIYGWTAQAHAPWIIPDLGVFIYSVGIGGNWTCIQTYLVDNYSIHAASAIAAASSFRALAGFGFPLFADKMYGALGDGWGNSILALICLVIGCPAPFVFYRYGHKLRSWSKNTSIEQ